MAWAPLKEACRPKMGPEAFRLAMRTSYHKYVGLTYDASAVDLGGAAAPEIRCLRDCCCFKAARDWVCSCLYGTERNTEEAKYLPKDNVPSNWLFCSELLAAVYKDFGIFDSKVVAADCIPIDLLASPGGKGTIDADKEVPLVIEPYVRFRADDGGSVL